MDSQAVILPERPLQHRRQGSLPLKKRITSDSLAASASAFAPTSLSTAAAASPIGMRRRNYGPTADETLAAMALIQAASSGPLPAYGAAANAGARRYYDPRPTLPSTSNVSQKSQQQYHQPLQLPLLPRMDPEHHEVKRSLLSLQSRAIVHAPANLHEESPSDLSTLDGESVGAAAAAERGRSNTFHTNTTRRPRRNTPTKTRPSALHHLNVQGNNHSVTDSSFAAMTDGRQDRRFTGLPHQVCCTATTTRGRQCAYVAVHAGNVCHLHAPTTNANALPHQLQQRARAEASRRKAAANKMQPPGFVDVSSAGLSTHASLLSPKLVPSPMASADLLNKKPRGRRASKLAEAHAESPYFLLSMIPSDQWRGKLVSVLVGPMKDQQGVVEKWSNGWVSVDLPSVGLHNRRSIELAIVKMEDDAKDFVLGATVAVNVRGKKTRGPGKGAATNRQDVISPLTLSDFDLYRRSAAVASAPPSPRGGMTDGTEPFDTPASRGMHYVWAPSVTPGSTASALGASHVGVYVHESNQGDPTCEHVALSDQDTASHARSDTKRRMQTPKTMMANKKHQTASEC